MKKILVIQILFLFSMCANNENSSSNKSSTIDLKEKYKYYNAVGDTTFYIGINHYHISICNTDSFDVDTITVVRINNDSITFNTRNPYYDCLINERWNISHVYSTFKINSDHSYKFDDSDKEITYIINFVFYNSDSLLYQHKRSRSSVTETYEFKGKRTDLH